MKVYRDGNQWYQLNFLFIAFFSVLVVACNTNENDGISPQSIKLIEAKEQSGLEYKFANPPNETKPLTWFHAMSGNMSKAGITKDLESLAKVGLGGTILFNVTQGIPIGDVKFNSDQHIDIISHMAAESERLGLTFGIHNADGWTSSGGPWITPKDSMKKVVWSEQVVKGGVVELDLRQPNSLHGYYQDIAVIGYPALDADLQNAQLTPKITASNADFDATVVTDNAFDIYTEVSYAEPTTSSIALSDHNEDSPSFTYKNMPWIQFEYPRPATIESVEGRFYEGRGLKFLIFASNDGKQYQFHQEFTSRRPGKRVWGADANIKPIKAKYFRVYANKAFRIQEMKLSANKLVDNYLGRTSIARTNFVSFKNIGEPEESGIIRSSSVIDLSHKMDSFGNLKAELPIGDWTIMRFGYTTTGAVNIPASKEGTGLEVDKFSRQAFDVHYGAFVTRVLERAKAIAPNATQFVEIDSYEVGGQNWTNNYERLFSDRFGYDLVPFLPLFAGKFVDSPNVSEGVLWDSRHLNGELIVDNYYAYFTELAHKDGVRTYIEPYGFGPFNDVDAGGAADIPMGEFWLKRDQMKISAAASAGHIYGKNLISAEAFTANPEHNWLFHPAMAKYDGDRGFALGVNELVFHRFAHQANTHVMPGMTMNRWGANIDRTQPWWETAGAAWFTYLSRSQLLLREGHSVSDVLWYLGDASPTACPEKIQVVDIIPSSINYDCVNSDVLTNRLKTKNGKMILPEGSSYKWMYLTNTDTLSLASLTALFELSKQRVVLVGKRPKKLANWRVNKEQVEAFDRMVDFIWAQPTTYTTLDWKTMYAKHDFALDLMVTDKPDVLFTHRKDAQKDIFFLSNPNSTASVFEITFDIENKIPELWDPMTGKITKSGVFKFTKDGRTVVLFTLSQNQSIFVIFREDATGIKSISPTKQSAQSLENGLTVELDYNNRLLFKSTSNRDYQLSLNESLRFSDVPISQQLENPWQVVFNEFYGLDKVYNFSQLVDWAEHPDSKIQDYSGTASYSTTFNIEDSVTDEDHSIWLDLGVVDISASVFVNGNSIGVSWMPPHKLDITEFVQVGENTLTIEVANLWVNRLIADQALPDTSGFVKAKVSNNPTTPMVQWYKDNQPPPKSERITFTTQPFYKATDKRISSGLLGPVKITFEGHRLAD